MAARIDGGDFTVSGTPTSLTSLLGLSVKRHFSILTVRSDPANAGLIYGGNSDVTVGANRLFMLQPGEGISFDLNHAWTDTDQMFLVATSPGDRVYEVDVQ